MQIKTIERIISTKLEAWLETITDTLLRKNVRDNLLVSGGSIVSLFLKEQVNDFDIYLKDINVVKSLANYYVRGHGVEVWDGRRKQELSESLESNTQLLDGETFETVRFARAVSLRNLQQDQIKLFFPVIKGGMKVNESLPVGESDYHPVYFSPNAISLCNQIQIVLRFHGDSQAIHKTFDFIHATNYFTFTEGLVTNVKALESILTKQLMYQGSFYPVTSLIRIKKFTKRGWNIGAGEMLKIIFQVSELELTDPDVLEEQLIGVDVAYFDLLIEALRGKIEKDPTFKMTSSFLNILIDRIFSKGIESEE